MAFLLIDIWAAGTTSLLLNRATEEALSGRTRSNNPGEPLDPRVVAERAVYRFNDKQLAIPGAAVARMLREAGGSHKSKGSRKSLKYIVPAAVLVLDDLLGLYLADRKTKVTDFEVDSRPVTIPATKGRIMRHRARLNEWAFKARLRINTDILDENMVRRLLIEGLQQIGLGDYRPEKGGPFGTSDLVLWQVTSEPRKLDVAQKRVTRAVA
jgi:hypothetical protein